MKDEQTICYKVTRSIETLEKAVKTHKLDVSTLAHNLHKIREQAQLMEDGLKRRKKIMIREGFEEEYQSLKTKSKITEGINQIKNEDEERVSEKTKFEFTIKKEGEVIYQNTSYAGVVCIVEKVEDIDENGQIDGQTQKFMFGNPLTIWFAFDQLKIAVEAKSLEIMQAIKQAIEAKKFIDPKVRSKIINFTNRMEGKND